jgi:hypothetical protein
MASDQEINRILAERELYRRGNLDYLLHEGQVSIKERIFRSKRQVQPILCARGYGKTYLGAEIATATCIKKPSRVKIGTEFYTDLEEFILPNFEAVLKDCPRSCLPTWKSSKGKWVFPERVGSQIQLIGLDRKPNGLRGTHKTDLIVLEEAGFISKLKQIYYSVIVPTTMHRPDCKILLPTTPPETLDHFFWTLFDMVQIEEDVPIFTIDDNPLLTRADILRIETEMLGRDSIDFQREYLCKRIPDAKRQLTPEFSKERHVTAWQRAPYFKFLRKTSSLDTGVRHLTVQLYSAYDFPKATLHIEDELVLRQNEVLTDTIYERTAEQEKALQYGFTRPDGTFEPQVSRWADNNNLILIQDLNKKGFKDGSGRYWSPTAKDAIEAGVNMVREWLRQGRLKIHPRCRVLIGTLETCLWNKRRTDFDESEVYGHADALASLIYLLRNVDVATNPIPLTWSVDLDNSFVRNHNAQTGSAKVLAEGFGMKRKR